MLNSALTACALPWSFGSTCQYFGSSQKVRTTDSAFAMPARKR
jgi:hypothetical protein